MTPLSERVREILSEHADGISYSVDKPNDLEIEIDCANVAVKKLLQAFREVVPVKSEGEPGLCECEYLQCNHGGWNAHHDATVERIK